MGLFFKAFSFAAIAAFFACTALLCLEGFMLQRHVQRSMNGLQAIAGGWDGIVQKPSTAIITAVVFAIVFFLSSRIGLGPAKV